MKWMCKRLAVAAALSLCAPALGTTWFVDVSATPGGDGSSWPLAANSLAVILNNPGLAAGDEIRIAQGTYKPGTTQGATFNIALNRIVLRGGYRGGSVHPDARNVDLYPTILTGVVAPNAHCRHVVTISGLHNLPEDNPRLDGLTIQDGAATSVGAGGDQDADHGGGLLVLGSGVDLLQCTLRSNSATEGGGIYFRDSRADGRCCCAADGAARGRR